MMAARSSMREEARAGRWVVGSKTGEVRPSGVRRRFVPRVAELETRRLLSQLVVVNNADSGPGSLRRDRGGEPGRPDQVCREPSRSDDYAREPAFGRHQSDDPGFSPGWADDQRKSRNGNISDFRRGPGQTDRALDRKRQCRAGGAIDNAGSLTIRSSLLMNNQAVGNASMAGMGGAIYNEPGASLSLLQSRLLDNQAIDNVVSGGSTTGGAVQSATGSRVSIVGSTFKFDQAISNQGPNGRAAGGALADSGATLSIANSRFASNSAAGFLLGESGAIHNLDGAVSISNSVFANNQGMGTGPGGYAASGAVTNKSDSSGSATMTIRNSSFTGNQAIAIGTGGDGVTTLSAAFGGAMGTSGSNVIVNVSASRFTGNQAIAAMPSSTSTGNLFAGIAVGGAIENDSGAVFNLRNSVVSGNRSRGGAGGANGSGGAAFGGGIGSFMDQATLSVTNTLVTGNAAQGGGGDFGDGWGGGIAVFQNGHATFSGVTLTGNRARCDKRERRHRIGWTGGSTCRRHRLRIEYAWLCVPRCVIGGDSKQSTRGQWRNWGYGQLLRRRRRWRRHRPGRGHHHDAGDASEWKFRARRSQLGERTVRQRLRRRCICRRRHHV